MTAAGRPAHHFTAIAGFPKEIECSICLDSWCCPVELKPCGHIYCKECIERCQSCPECRCNISSTVPPNRVLVNLANQVVVACDNCPWTGSREDCQRVHPKEACTPQSRGSQLPSSSNVGGYCPPVGQYPPQAQTPYGFTQAPPIYNGSGSYPPPGPSPVYNSGSYPHPPQQFYQSQSSSNYYPPPQGYHQYPPPDQTYPPPQRRLNVIDASHHSAPWVAYDLQQTEYDQIMGIFITFDEDDSGELSRPQMKRLCKCLNYARSDSDIERIFSQMDVDGSGALSMAEFCTWLKYNKADPQTLYGLPQYEYNTILMHFFEQDSNQDGSLDVQEFIRLGRSLGMAPDIAEMVFQEIDINHDGGVDLHEYLMYRKACRR